MSNSCTTAVILCAGRGTRMGDLTVNQPKCLIHVDGQPILERAVLQFRQVGVRRIVLVVGYLKDAVMARFEGASDIFAVENYAYAQTNTMLSLWEAREYLRDGFWLLNGDVVFDSLAFTRFGANPSEIGVIPGRCGDEEVKARVGEGGVVLELSKEVSPESALGESVGLARFSPAFAGSLVTAMNHLRQPPGAERLYFEAAVEAAMQHSPLHVASLAGIAAIEIDTPHDLARAQHSGFRQVER